MATFEIVEQEKVKMIKATINNETIRAEAGALHYMQGRIELKADMPSAGGFLKAMVTQETAVKPTYTGTGVIFFGPPIFGEYMELEVDGTAWIIDTGAYVCSDIGVEVGVHKNKGANALFGGEGWFQTKVEGKGKVIIQAPGPLQAIDLKNDRLAVDGNFAVAREAQLEYSVQKATKGMFGSAASGEGLLNVFEGTGRVYIAPVANAYVALGRHVAAHIVIPSCRS